MCRPRPKAARASGKKLSDVVKMQGKDAKSTTLKLPDSVKNWVGDFLPAQVYDTWMELEKKTPRGDLNL